MRLEDLLLMTKALSDPTRARIVALLLHGELTVSELTHILLQSQPRISRHLKLLTEADILNRQVEGAWVYYRLSTEKSAYEFVEKWRSMLAEDETIKRDLERLQIIHEQRQKLANQYFTSVATEWNDLREHLVDTQEVEEAILAMLDGDAFEKCLDLGTGTGRMLELLSAHYKQGLGLDISVDMLRIARSQLQKNQITHAKVVQADLLAPPMDTGAADLLIMHQVLHYFDDPLRALQTSTQLLRPHGTMLIIDFDQHNLEILRERFSHRRLGFSREQIQEWVSFLGLEMLEARTLDPPNQDLQNPVDENLTVNLWKIKKPE